MFTVGELSRLTGITVRTLHHYDEIGLVRPSQRNAAGHRLYGDADVVRLQHVLVYRELGIPLEQIAAVLDDERDPREVLHRHRDALVAKRARIDAMLAAVTESLANLEKGQTMSMKSEDVKSMFDGFDPSEYEQEAEQRWGHTDAYKESQRRTKQYGPADWERMKQEASAIYQRLLDRMRANAPVSDPVVQAAVEDHRMHIDRWFYPCSKEMQKGLGSLYVSDPRFTANLDKIAPGFARYLSDAIAAS
ncbi:MAG: MerR family transcriptional regulator [Kofleriaceae bacterium]